jgi:hypothetical protein
MGKRVKEKRSKRDRYEGRKKEIEGKERWI